MPTFQMADENVHKLVQKLIDKRPELKDSDVTFQVQFAYGSNGSPALTANGYPCAGKIKINNLEKRVGGLPDCTILVNGDAWADWSERRREAVLAHEVCHLQLQRDDQGFNKVDDIGRPKLKLKKHDFQIGIFTEVAVQYGEDALDTEQAKEVAEWVQGQLFPRG